MADGNRTAKGTQIRTLIHPHMDWGRRSAGARPELAALAPGLARQSSITSPVGIASIGISVCQGVLSYCNSWEDCPTDIASTCDHVEGLRKTFTLLQGSLANPSLDPAKRGRVKECLDACVDGLEKLQQKLETLRVHSNPSGVRQKAWSRIQRLSYPFKESTLAKLREIVGDLRGRLALALQVLRLDLNTRALSSLSQLDVSVAQMISQTLSLSLGVQDILSAQQADQYREIVSWLSPPDQP